MNFQGRFNKLHAKALTRSSEDLGPTEEDHLSEGQIREIEERKELEDAAIERQEALDAITKEMANRDDGDGEIGDIRDTLLDVRQSQNELAGIRKQLEVAEQLTMAAPDQQDPNAIPADNDPLPEPNPDDPIVEPKADPESDDDDPDEDPEDEDEDEDDDDEDEDEEDEEIAAVESIRIQLDCIYSRLGCSVGIESYTRHDDPSLARKQLLDVVGRLEATLEGLEPSMEWFNINALRTNIVSIFSVTKALEMNKKLIDMGMRKNGAKATYEPVMLPAWAVDLVTREGSPTRDFKSDVRAFCDITRKLVAEYVLARNQQVHDILGSINSDADVGDINDRTSALLSNGHLSGLPVRGGVMHTINNGKYRLSDDDKSGFRSVVYERLVADKRQIDGVMLTPTVMEAVPGSMSLVLSAQDISEIIGMLLDLRNDIKSFSDTMETAHKNLAEFKSVRRMAERERTDLLESVKRLESVALGLYTSTDSIASAVKHLVYRVTALAAHVKF